MSEITPKRRLLEAMIILNAINNGRPIPDMENIEGGWVLPIDPDQSREETKAQIIDELEADGVTVRGGQEQAND